MDHGGRKPLRISAINVAGTSVLTAQGALSYTTYVQLRNAIVKAALDEPAAVVIDVTGLVIKDETALAVFVTAHWQVAEWPKVPIGLVCAHTRGQAALRRNGVTRYVPVYPTLQSATTELPERALRTYRQRARATLTAEKSSSRVCRHLISEWLTTWARTDFIHAVSTVATELVENALIDTDRTFSLRVETDGSTMTVAVQHTSTRAPTRRVTNGETLFGVDIVTATSRVWGSYTTAAGTTVWAVIGPENRF
jgi:STAS domain-containing protein